MTDNPQYELVDQGNQWAAVRDGKVFGTWDREADPTSSRGILWQMTPMVEQRLGRRVTWVQHDTGYRPALAW